MLSLAEISSKNGEVMGETGSAHFLWWVNG
jgi:hypothetical protein